MENSFTEFIKDVFLIFGTLTISFTAASIITSYLLKDDFSPKSEETEEEFDSESESKKEIFLKKYEVEFDKLDVRTLKKEEEEEIKEQFCEEDCPRGKIIMRYNFDEKTFEYFSNSRNIPHSYLDVVAKKFTIENDCKALFQL